MAENSIFICCSCHDTPDYTNGEIQYQATLMAPSNENKVQ